MANNLLHSPAEIIRKLLVDLALGAEPSATATWPVYDANEPATPDNCITVYDTQGRDYGRMMIDGSLVGPNGFQVRVRAKDHPTGWLKADSIQKALAEIVYQRMVYVESSDYFIHCISTIGDVLSLGKDPNSNRRLFTINAVVTVRQLT